jgi:hypothetical protein
MPKLQAKPRGKQAAGAESYDLETALEALDVDLDDLAVPHAATQLQREAPTAAIRPSALRRPDPDEVVIDFEDDD